MSGKKCQLIIKHKCDKTEAYLISKSGDVLGHAAQSHKLEIAKPGWVEYDPLEATYALRSAISSVLKVAKLPAKNIHSVGILAEPQSMLVFDKDTGQPLTPILPAACERASAVAQILSQTRLGKDIHEITGVPFNPHTLGAKIKWIRDNMPEVKAQLDAGTALVGTVDTWLVFHLTGRKSIVMASSQAAQTLLLDPVTQKWDPFLMKEFGLSAKQLPAIISIGQTAGNTSGFVPLPDAIPISAISTLAAMEMMGQGAFNYGQAGLHFGSLSTLRFFTGGTFVASQPTHTHGLMLTPDGPAHYKESYTLSMHSMLRWLQRVDYTAMNTATGSIEKWNDKLNFDDLQLPPQHGLHIIPANLNSISPANKAEQTFHILGITSQTRFQDIENAVMASVAHCVKVLIDNAETNYSLRFKSLHITGDMAHANPFTQYLADVLQIPVTRYKSEHSAVLSAAWAMHLVTPFFAKTQTLSKVNRVEITYLPEIDPLSSFTYQKTWENGRKLAAQ